jgi:RNA polymerase sigma-70 factor (ECF subfamily)
MGTATACCSISPARLGSNPVFLRATLPLVMIANIADEDLVLRIAQGDHQHEAETELCRRFGPRVRLYGLRHLHSEDLAADLVQSVLLAVLEATRAGRIEEASHLDRFILGTCRNIAHRVREREARSTPMEAAALEPHTRLVEPSFERIDVGALLNCLGRLDARARSVILLSFQSESGTDEIAKLLETSVGNIRVLRHRALADLRGCLDGVGGARA